MRDFESGWHHVEHFGSSSLAVDFNCKERGVFLFSEQREEKRMGETREEQEYSIVLATLQDVPKIAQLYDAITATEAQGENFSGWEQGEYPQEWTAKELLSAGGLYCIFDESGETVIASAAYDNCHEDCYSLVEWEKKIPNEKTLCIHTLAVHPDYRRWGLGEKLMRFGFEKVRELGLEGIRIDTWVNNLPGLRLYHRLGYQDAQVLSENVHYDGDTMAYQFLEWYPDFEVEK